MNDYLESLVARATRANDPSALRPPPYLSVLPPVPRETASVARRTPESWRPTSRKPAAIAPRARWDESRPLVARRAVDPAEGRELEASGSARPGPLGRTTAAPSPGDRGRSRVVQGEPTAQSVDGASAGGAEEAPAAIPATPASGVRPGHAPPRWSPHRIDQVPPEPVVASPPASTTAPRPERARLTERPLVPIGAIP